MTDWAKWLQDAVSDLLGYLDAIQLELERIRKLLEERADR